MTLIDLGTELDVRYTIPAVRPDSGGNMSTAQESIDVNVPVHTAYNQWTQFESFPEFMGGVDEVRQLDDKHLHWKVSVAGVSREYDAEITEQTPDQVVAWRAAGETDNAGRVTFEKLADDSTRVSVELTYETEGLMEKAGNALNVPDRQLKKDLTRFKEFIESRGAETGAWRGDIH
jgi:uncharacterized membrane protein